MANVPYTWQEYFDMFGCLTNEDVNGDPRRAANLYRLRFQDEGRRMPDHRVFINLQARLARNGPLVPGVVIQPRQGRRQIYGVDPNLEFLILAQFADSPNLSTRVCALRLGLGNNQHRLVDRVVKANGLYPCKYQKVQGLILQDLQRRINFSNTILHRHIQDPNILRRILYTDECTFTLKGMFNSKNYVEWRDQNPFNVRATKHQWRWSINVWAGIIDQYLV